MNKFSLIFLVVFWANLGFSQLVINQTLTPAQLVQNTLVGSGVTITNVTYSGAYAAIGRFTNGGTTNIGFQTGIVITSGSAGNCVGPNSSNSITGNNNAGSDPQLAALINGTVNDAAALEFDFIPIADTIKFRYVFGSDEYPEFSNSTFNDVFGFFISGPNPAGGNYLHHNMAIIPNTTNTPVSINNINNGTSNSGPCMNCQYYINNTSGITIEYDGISTVLTAYALVVPCSTYHFKAAIGDVGDYSYDSGVFLEANSFSSSAVQISTGFSVIGAFPHAIEGCNNAVLTATLPKVENFAYSVPIDSMWGTAINGVDFNHIPDSIIIPAGSKSATLSLIPIVDNIVEGIEYFNFLIKTSVCTNDTIEVEIYDYTPIIIASKSSDTMVCGDTANLFVNPIHGLQPYYFQWKPSILFNNSGLSQVKAFPPQSTYLTISITDTTGCPAVVDSIYVEVNPKPSVSFLPSPFNGCEPLSVNFQDMSFPNIGKWDWTFGDGNTASIQNPTHVYAAGTFGVQLSVETVEGCSASFYVPNIITAYPKPKPFFEAVPPVTTIDEPTISFTDMSQNGINYWWSFGEPSSSDNNSSLTSPSHTYSNDGVYQVWLILTSDRGCVDSIKREVMVIIDEIKVPNIITPNGDGFNDVFYIENIDKLEWSNIIIYNRWGMVVYRSENYKNDWNAENLADGVYHFTLEYKTYFRSAKEQGIVTVIRQ
jgi:gliding motility-associated-like protein